MNQTNDKEKISISSGSPRSGAGGAAVGAAGGVHRGGFVGPGDLVSSTRAPAPNVRPSGGAAKVGRWARTCGGAKRRP